MEGGKKKSGSSSSSFTSDLFGAKGSSANAQSSRTLASIFAPSDPHLSETEKQKESAKQGVVPKTTVSGASKDNYAYNYQEENIQPLNYSSSIFYGGQDFYGQPQTRKNDGLTTFNKDVGEDESGSASRGNWWKGSLYY